MGTETRGKVEVAARLENQFDLSRVQAGILAPADVRHVEVENALVDTGAAYLAVPRRYVSSLGLFPVKAKRVRTSNGIVTRTIYEPVRLTIQGRDIRCEVTELPDDCLVLIGQIPLEGLDFVVDPAGRRLIGNPAHGGEAMYEEFLDW